MQNFQCLYDFLDSAVRNRKYPEATANAIRSALKIYEGTLNNEERDSLEKFRSNFDQITKGVFLKNAKRFNSSSLATYTSRVHKVVNDYYKYGTDPTKMNNWLPKSRQSTKKYSSIGEVPQEDHQRENAINTGELKVEPNKTHRIELALRQDARFILIFPSDIKESEYKTIQSVLSSLVKKDNE